jgi:hypothetical protein
VPVEWAGLVGHPAGEGADLSVRQHPVRRRTVTLG